MKYFLLLLAVLFPSFASAQTPSIYTTWSPSFMGSKIHITISEHQIIAFHPANGSKTGLAQFITVPGPEGSSSASTQNISQEPPMMEKMDTAVLLKVVFDSAQAKGRLFVEADKKKGSIIVFTFLLKDDGTALLGLATDPVKSLEYSYSKKAKKQPTLKELEKSTSPNAKKKATTSTSFGMFGGFGNVTLSFYNPVRTAEFAKMKDPAVMPKQEMIGIINSFADRMAAALAPVKVDTGSYEKMFELIGPFIQNAQVIIHDVFIAHGYNPLAVGAMLDGIEKDEDFKTAIELAGTKIEESVPVLRDLKAKRETQARIYKESEMKSISADTTNLQKARTLSDLKTSVYDETGSLTKEQTESLVQKLKTAKSTDEMDIAVVVIPSLDGLKAKPAYKKWNGEEGLQNSVSEDVASNIRSWNNIGRKTRGRGIVIFLAKDSRQGFISTGWGNMGGLTNKKVGQIYDESLTPSLKENKYYEGIDKTIDALIAGSKEEVSYPADSVVATELTPAAPPPPVPAPAPPAPTAVGAQKSDFTYMTKEPKPLTNVQTSVVYPESARKAGIEGKVTYSALVGKDGRVIKVTIDHADNEAFKQPVIDAVMKTRFTPAKQGDQTVKVWYTQSVSFKLGSGE